jgi:uncharacterized protein YegJ (DUF2314 family)
MRFSQLFPILLFATITLACNGQTNQTNDPIVFREAADPELEAAKQEALSRLEYFITSFHQHPEDSTLQFSLKTDFEENGEHEHMWIGVTQINNGKFVGVLRNDPQLIQSFQYGDTVEITKEQIEDWIIYHTDTDSLEGGFSIKILQSRE